MIRPLLTRLIRQISGDDVPPPAPAAPPQMSDQDRDVIFDFALGNVDLRDRAVAIHRAYIPVLGVRGALEMRFMAEVDNPAPDLALRGYYRELLLGREAA